MCPDPLPRDVNEIMRAETLAGIGHEGSMAIRKRIRLLNQIDPTLGQHPDGIHATAIVEGFEDISREFEYFFKPIPGDSGLTPDSPDSELTGDKESTGDSELTELQKTMSATSLN